MIEKWVSMMDVLGVDGGYIFAEMKYMLDMTNEMISRTIFFSLTSFIAPFCGIVRNGCAIRVESRTSRTDGNIRHTACSISTIDISFKGILE